MARIRMIGVPLDLGSNQRGVEMGPSLLRAMGLHPQLAALGHDVVDAGNLAIKIRQQVAAGDPKAKYLEEVVDVCNRLTALVRAALQAGETPLLLGGDHSMAVGSIAGVAGHAREKRKKIGLLWFDAHGDINTPETTPSGNIHGMPLAASLGLGPESLARVGGEAPKLDPKKVCLIGARDIDPMERDNIRKSGIRVFTMRDIDEKRMSGVMREALEVVSDGTAGFHVSFDMDFVDPLYAPAVGTPVKGGATYREAHLAMEMVADSGRMLGFDLAELNPARDQAGATATLGVELIASAFGKRIL